MKLPKADYAVIPTSKLRDYLLSPIHPIGRYKALFFQALGYDQGVRQILEDDLRALLPQDADKLDVTKYGTKTPFGVNRGPNGRTARSWLSGLCYREKASPGSSPLTRRIRQ